MSLASKFPYTPEVIDLQVILENSNRHTETIHVDSKTEILVWFNGSSTSNTTCCDESVTFNSSDFCRQFSRPCMKTLKPCETFCREQKNSCYTTPSIGKKCLGSTALDEKCSEPEPSRFCSKRRKLPSGIFRPKEKKYGLNEILKKYPCLNTPCFRKKYQKRLEEKLCPKKRICIDEEVTPKTECLKKNSRNSMNKANKNCGKGSSSSTSNTTLFDDDHDKSRHASCQTDPWCPTLEGEPCGDLHQYSKERIAEVTSTAGETKIISAGFEAEHGKTVPNQVNATSVAQHLDLKKETTNVISQNKTVKLQSPIEKIKTSNQNNADVSSATGGKAETNLASNTPKPIILSGKKDPHSTVLPAKVSIVDPLAQSSSCTSDEICEPAQCSNQGSITYKMIDDLCRIAVPVECPPDPCRPGSNASKMYKVPDELCGVILVVEPCDIRSRTTCRIPNDTCEDILPAFYPQEPYYSPSISTAHGKSPSNEVFIASPMNLQQPTAIEEILEVGNPVVDTRSSHKSLAVKDEGRQSFEVDPEDEVWIMAAPKSIAFKKIVRAKIQIGSDDIVGVQCFPHQYSKERIAEVTSTAGETKKIAAVGTIHVKPTLTQ